LHGWALAMQGQGEEGIAQVRQGIAAGRATGAALYVPYMCTMLAEVCRLQGVLLLKQTKTPQEEAETSLRRALDLARRQEAKSLELRAAMSLARLWQQQGKRQDAHDLLAPVYDWFTEGFDTADLQDAKTLLEALA